VMRGNEGDEMPAWFSYSHTEESGRRWRTAWRRRPKEAAAQTSGGGRPPGWAELLGRKAVIGPAGMVG
jgi:hypothetical protein